MVEITALTILFIGLSFFFIGKNKVVSLCNSTASRPHSLVFYYGIFPAILATAPALIILSLWVAFDVLVFNQMLVGQFPSDLEIEGRQTVLILLAQIKNISNGIVVGQPDIWILESAEKLTSWQGISNVIISSLAAAISFLGGLYGVSLIKPEFRARNSVEVLLLAGLAICSVIAIITTIGIVFSVIFQSQLLFQFWIFPFVSSLFFQFVRLIVFLKYLFLFLIFLIFQQHQP